MADCLDRTESQAIRGDDFFSMHNKSSKLIDPNTLCISALDDAEICSENCDERSGALIDSMPESISTSERSELKKQIENQSEVEITSDFFVLNDNCSVKSSHPPFRESINDSRETGVGLSSLTENDNSDTSVTIVSPLLNNDKSFNNAHDKFNFRDDVNSRSKTVKSVDLEKVISIVTVDNLEQRNGSCKNIHESDECNSQSSLDNSNVCQEDVKEHLKTDTMSNHFESQTSSAVSDKVSSVSHEINCSFPSNHSESPADECCVKEDSSLISNENKFDTSKKLHDISCGEEIIESQTGNYILNSHHSDSFGSEIMVNKIEIEKPLIQNQYESTSSDLSRDIIDMNETTLEIEIKEETYEDMEEIPTGMLEVTINKDEMLDSEIVSECKDEIPNIKVDETVEYINKTPAVAQDIVEEISEGEEEMSESKLEGSDAVEIILDCKEEMSEGIEEISDCGEEMQEAIEEIEVEMPEDIPDDDGELIECKEELPLITQIVNIEEEASESKEDVKMPCENVPAVFKEFKECSNTSLNCVKRENELHIESDEITANSEAGPSFSSLKEETDIKTEELKHNIDDNKILQKEVSKCIVRLVPLEDGSSKEKQSEIKKKEKGKSRYGAGFAEKLESLTGTVKIGCLSVTPLNPNLLKNDSENVQCDDAPKKKLNIEDKIVVGNEDNLKHEGSKPIAEGVSVFLKANEKLIKNNVEITISPKSSDAHSSPQSYLENAADTLKVKIPQLIDSCTGKVRNPEKEKHHSERQEYNKNFIVNKNLKVIESFLMQKGFQREANILKEKTDIIKPYLEDIALKLERSINERTPNLSSHPESKDTPTTEFSRFINDYNKRSEPKNDCSVERELNALTEKFLNSSTVNSKVPKNYDDMASRSVYGYLPCSTSSGMPDKRLYEQFYGKPYFDGLDYLSKKEYSAYSNRMMDPHLADHYRSMRHQMRESDYCLPPPDMGMYDQFLSEFDNKLHPSMLLGSSNAFRNSDFSLFIDAYTAEKYNNFIHFMVPDSEAISFEMIESGRMENDLNYMSSVQMMDRCHSVNPYWSPSTNQYYSHASSMMPPASHPPSLRPINKMYPPIGHPLPVDSSKESCGQLTITPLDESGKPYGPRSATEPSSNPSSCCETYSSAPPVPTPGILPPLPPTIPSDSLSHQLTITPLHQSANLPYLHRSSANRRRGRPPMDPDYDVVGYRKDAFPYQRFSRSDFMARVRSNIEPYPDPRSYDPPRMSKVSSEVEHKPADVKPQFEAISLPKSIPVLPPTGVPLVVAPVAISPVDSPPVKPPVTPTPILPVIPTGISPITKTVTSSSTPSTPVSKSLVVPSSLISNGYKKSDQPECSEEKVFKKTLHVEIVPKPSVASLPPSSPQCLKKSSFQMVSKQVKIIPSALPPASGIKISCSDVSTKSENSNKIEITPTSKTNKDSKKSPEVLIMKKITPGLENVLNNSSITLKTIQVSCSPVSSNKISKEVTTKEENKVPANIQNIPSSDKIISSVIPGKIIDKKDIVIKTNEQNKVKTDICKSIEISLPRVSLSAIRTNDSVSKQVGSSPVDNAIIRPVDSSPVNNAIIRPVDSSPVNNAIIIPAKKIRDESSHLVEPDQSTPTQSCPTAKKTSPTKPKRRKRFLTFQKKRKSNTVVNKSPSEEVAKVVRKTPKVVCIPSIVKVKEKSVPAPSSANSNKVQSTKVSVNKESTPKNKEPEPVTNDNMDDSLDKSGDGVRRSGRKRKIIEGNPKFKDMERVDLKYFREERMKPAPVKRKLDTKTSVKPEPSPKKRIVSEIKQIPSKEQRISNTHEEKPITDSVPKAEGGRKEDEIKTKEKLQQFLDVNDIYLKPQTFV